MTKIRKRFSHSNNQATIRVHTIHLEARMQHLRHRRAARIRIHHPKQVQAMEIRVANPMVRANHLKLINQHRKMAENLSKATLKIPNQITTVKINPNNRVVTITALHHRSHPPHRKVRALALIHTVEMMPAMHLIRMQDQVEVVQVRVNNKAERAAITEVQIIVNRPQAARVRNHNHNLQNRTQMKRQLVTIPLVIMKHRKQLN